MNSIAPKIVAPHDGRRQSRTHLFVIATLYSNDCSDPVHIRNISSSGALVEAAVLPETGAKVVLRRGSLKTAGKIAWRLGRRAGIAFEATAYVADWMLRQASGHQNRVDEPVCNLRAGAGQGAGTVTTANELPGDAPIAVELTLLRAELAELGNALLGDEIMIATHPEIQTLDISLGRIDRLLLRFETTGDGPTL